MPQRGKGRSALQGGRMLVSLSSFHVFPWFLSNDPVSFLSLPGLVPCSYPIYFLDSLGLVPSPIRSFSQTFLASSPPPYGHYLSFCCTCLRVLLPHLAPKALPVLRERNFPRHLLPPPLIQRKVSVAF